MVPMRQVLRQRNPSVRPELEVLLELPTDAERIHEWVTLCGLRTVHGWFKGDFKRFYYCHYCAGWIEGSPSEVEVDTGHRSFMVLAGRRGTEYHCLRCGTQIAFDGIIS